MWFTTLALLCCAGKGSIPFGQIPPPPLQDVSMIAPVDSDDASGDTHFDAPTNAPLAPLPVSSLRVAPTKYVIRTPEPSSRCPAETGWDGRACVNKTCDAWSIFRKGWGCVPCLGECVPNAEWDERAPWSDSPTPFDRQAAWAALSRVVLSGCKRSGDPTGRGIAEVTFLPSGAVHDVVVDAEGFAGTPAGACIEASFKSVRVPKFGGSPVTVSKPFTLD